MAFKRVSASNRGVGNRRTGSMMKGTGNYSKRGYSYHPTKGFRRSKVVENESVSPMGFYDWFAALGSFK